MSRAALFVARLSILAASVTVLTGGLSPSRAEDAASEFTPLSNTAGAPWTYGWKPVRTGTFTIFTNSGTDGTGQQYWNLPATGAGVYYNPLGTAITPGGNTYIPPKTLSLLPGAEDYAVVRWTAGVAGSYEVRTRFTARSIAWASKDVAVVQGTNVVFSAWLNPYHIGNTTSMSAVLTLNVGETIDFVVGPGGDGNFSDVTGLDATVNIVPPAAGPAGPVFAFAGQRFLPCRWSGDAFESIAFDPIQRRLASQNDLTDLCGNFISDGPDEQPGLAWDIRTQTYWQITGNRVVRRWSAAGALLDTVFTINSTFTVPETGLDTLESPRGIAVDSNFVYVVDAGPDPGQISSNAWFKFTRAGAPVKSSKSTNFLANLDADPDALVDDIVYAPFTSVLLPGRLLIALEHSGIQVIDTEGNFVTKFRWSTQGLTPPRSGNPPGKLNAFAGLALDPATGNLYLVDNDTGDCQVWTRVAAQGATSYFVGVPGGYLQYPNPGCNLPLWTPIAAGPGAPSNFFGAGYRASNHAVYTCNYGSGELWRFDARVGKGTRIGHTGVGNTWGLAYDTQRNVLYGGQDLGLATRVVTIDPATGNVSPLTQQIPYTIRDLAFNSADNFIYGVDIGIAPARLIRIDRDTGAGVVVGNTNFISGLDYDAATDKLIGIHNDSKLYSITPATGAAVVLTTLPVNAGWEGLAVVPLPANPGVVGVEDDIVSSEIREALRAWPNPSRESMAIEFALPHEAQARVRVFDVTGRMVKEVRSQHFASGPHRVDWDGRDDAGDRVASGIYFVRVESAAHTMVTRVTRLR